MGGGEECREQSHIVTNGRKKMGTRDYEEKKKDVSKGDRFRVYRFLQDYYDLGTL